MATLYFSISRILKTRQSHFLALLFSTLLTFPLAAQVSENGTVKGKVITADSLNAELVVVGLKGINKGATTNKEGEFTIDQVPAGSYTLVVQIVGYETIETPVQVQAGETTTVENIQLKEDSKTLHEVVVEGNRNKFAQRESDYVARLPISNLENPQVYNTVTKELMQEQVIVNFDDAIKNTPGVTKLWTSTGRGSDGAGYFSMRGFSVQPSLVNGIAGQTNGGIDPANIEKLESIKGPSGTLFGSSLISFGGLLNIVTKKPYETFGGEISYTAGTFDLNRITLDVNSPINKEKTLLVRLNSAYHYEGSFQDAGFQKKLFVAPSITYKFNNRLSVNVTTEIMNSEGTNPLSVFLNRERALIRKTIDELDIDWKKSFTSNDITIKNQTINIFGQINYRINDQWTSQTNLSRSIRTSDGYYSYVMFQDRVGLTFNGVPAVNNDDTLNRLISDQTAVGKTTQAQQNFIGDFKIGKMRNRLVAGVDFLSLVLHNNSTPYILFDRVNARSFTPVTGSSDPNNTQYNKLNEEALAAKIAASTQTNSKTGSETRTYSAYVSNVLNVTPKLLLMASLRFDHFVNMGSYNYANNTTTANTEYSQNALSPKLGVVYQIVKDKVSVFGNYMNGYRNVAPVTSLLPDEFPGTFKPQQANQMEGGVKLEAFNQKLSMTVCYYNLLVTNITRSESVTRNAINYNVTVQNGSQQSEGFEVDLIASPIQGLNLIGGYAFNESKILKSAPSTEGRRPTTAGGKHQANAWISYTLTQGKVKGLGAGLGGNYMSENIITNSLATGEFALPSYVVANATVFYGTPRYRVAIKVDNLTNEAYYAGWSTIERQMPRRFMASFTFKF
ncbi:MAG: TonB-dependent receptor [Cytophagaceae bacterium]|jgi:iron complex outermembrane receptor protein|nr:TonB-dependent receptor [Cytophagaceae bacterium]